MKKLLVTTAVIEAVAGLALWPTILVHVVMCTWCVTGLLAKRA